MSERMNIATYLRRIGYHGPLAPTLPTLRQLHVAHLLAVPFENLDIHQGRPIVLDEAALFDKIVGRRRGGFCYELNGLFAALLRTVGFQVALLSARVTRGDGNFGPEFDHMALLVQAEDSATGEELRMLADVGFGDSFREPLRLDDPGEQYQGMGAYRLTHNGDDWQMEERSEGVWLPQYRFTLQPRRLAEFGAMCQYHQTSPDSHFTRGRICSLARPDGRISLSDLRLITTERGERQEQVLESQEEYAVALREHFGFELQHS
jgi:N-hydroxyarylamine O-acetyltransferase